MQNIIINPKFKFNHLTATKFCGDMKDLAARKTLLDSLNLNSENLVILNQVHSANVCIARKKDGGKIFQNCDGAIACEKDLILGIFTADCAPVLIASKDAKIKAALHCGWRGVAGGIIENAVRIFEKEFKISAQNLSAYVGPCIQKCCYEVGAEFEEIFNVKLENSKLDLASIAEDKMKKLGIKEVVKSDKCTFCGGEFFSYRKDKTQKRQLTLIY